MHRLLSGAAIADQEPPSGIPSVAPWDEHNRRWVSNVRPAGWQNPNPSGRYNLAVIGAGPAGLVTAIGAAGLGAKVALVERHLVGGDCLNVGCVPSKALISASRSYAAVRNAEKFGVRVPDGVHVDFPAVMERMRRIRADLSRHDSAERVKGLGIDLFIGDGRFTARTSFEIGGKLIRFSKACIATGARAAPPPIPGLDTVDYLTNETVFTLTQLPRRFGVIGAGPIGCEMAQAFRRFGSEVHLIEAMHGILPREDREAAEIVKQSLLQDGVKFYCCGKGIRIDRDDQTTRISFDSHDQPYHIAVDKLLVAVGRVPNLEGLNLDKAGIEYDKKGIKVNDRLQTTNPRIFAAGDVASRYQFTHAADFMARIVIGNALFFGRSKTSTLTIPWATYTEPELAHVGTTSRKLDREGIGYHIHIVKMSDVDRAVLDGDTEGLVKVLADHKGRILGATIVSARAGDLIGQFALAMTHGLRLGAIAKTIHPYPTQGEAIRKTGDVYNRTHLTPLIRGMMTRFLKWRR